MLRAKLRGKKWESFGQRSVMKVGRIYFRARLGYIMGRVALAIIARKQFVLIEYLPVPEAKRMEVWCNIQSGDSRLVALDPTLVDSGISMRAWHGYFAKTGMILGKQNEV